jgi:hypothetical protein
MNRASALQKLEGLAVALLAYLLIWKGVWAGWHTLGSDFPQYYVVARLVAQHCCLDRIYDWVWLQRAADQAGVTHQLVGFSGLTPFSAFPVLPFTWLPIIEAKRVWIALNVGVLVALVLFLRKSTGLPMLRTWLIALLAVIPLRTSLALGQMHLLVCALLIAGWCFHLRGKQVASGCCIAIAGALKIYPLFYCFYFLIKRRWRALASTLVILAICAVLCYAVFGPTVMSAYLGEQLPRTLQGEGNNPFLASATSVSAMFHRLFLYEPELNPHPLVASFRLYATLYPLWQALLAAIVLLEMRSGAQSDDRETLEWCAFLSLLLFLSSEPATYHFVALIAAAVPTYAILRRRHLLLGVVFFVVYFVACNARNVTLHSRLLPDHTIILMPKLWAGVGLILMCAAVLIWWRPVGTASKLSKTELRLNRSQPRSKYVRPYATVTVIFAALWLLGFIGAWRHGRTIAIDNSRKLVTTDCAWMRTAPQSTPVGLFYLAMLNTGYRVMRDGVSIDAGASGDELSFAVDRKGNEVWIESADPRGSRITRIAQENATPGRCLIYDAESPALAADGSALAFIRENKGNGSVWITKPGSCAESLVGMQAVRVTPQSMDVRALSTSPDGGFIVSAVTSQGAGLFVISPGNTMTRLLQSPASIGSATFSADGNWLVISQLIANHWQLVAVDSLRHTQKQLTSSDCNSDAPRWKDSRTIVYATDCERGDGLTTLAELRFE